MGDSEGMPPPVLDVDDDVVNSPDVDDVVNPPVVVDVVNPPVVVKLQHAGDSSCVQVLLVHTAIMHGSSDGALHAAFVLQHPSIGSIKHVDSTQPVIKHASSISHSTSSSQQPWIESYLHTSSTHDTSMQSPTLPQSVSV